MKNRFLFTCATLICFVWIASCKKEDNSSPSNSSSNPSVASLITSGTWCVTYFHEDNSDHTADFNGYAFAFNGNGTMTAVNASGTTTGTWRVNDSNANEFHMSVGNSDPLSKLDKGWIITSEASTEIKMKDDNSSNNEELHFTKN
jgi:hypothetical protein